MDIVTDGGTGRPRLTATRPLSTAVKVLALLDALADTDEPVRVSALARTLGLPRGEVHRQLVTLEAAGWMQQLPDGAYQLTLRPAHVGHAALRQAGIGERTAPFLDAAARRSGEVVSIAVLDADTARVVQRSDPDRSLHATLLLGDRLSLHRSASGRLLAAEAPDDVAAALRVRGVALPDEDALAVIRGRGWATSTDDEEDGVTALALPVRRHDGRVVAALSVHGPRDRITTADALDALRPALREIEHVLRLDTSATLGLHA